MKAFEDLVEIVARLRGPGGCPWDQAQTTESLRRFVIEEAYEVVDAIDRRDPEDLKRELGDVTFQVLLLSSIAHDEGWFSLEDVLTAIQAKMVRRHPHVFDPEHGPVDAPIGNAAWERLKRSGRPAGASILDGVPAAMPALLRARRVSDKAAAVGFDWPGREAVREKVDEELEELDQALAVDDEGCMVEEYGDLLFTLVNLGRHLPEGAEAALQRATRKFERRFRELEATIVAEGGSIHDMSAETLEARWLAVKAAEEGAS